MKKTVISILLIVLSMVVKNFAQTCKKEIILSSDKEMVLVYNVVTEIDTRQIKLQNLSTVDTFRESFTDIKEYLQKVYLLSDTAIRYAKSDLKDTSILGKLIRNDSIFLKDSIVPSWKHYFGFDFHIKRMLYVAVDAIIFYKIGNKILIVNYYLIFLELCFILDVVFLIVFPIKKWREERKKMPLNLDEEE